MRRKDGWGGKISSASEVTTLWRYTNLFIIIIIIIIIIICFYYYKRAEEMRVNGWENDKRIGNGRERKENGKGVKGLE